MNRLTHLLLRTFLILVALALVYFQIAVPALARSLADEYPEFRFMATPYSFISVLSIALAQICILSVWILLNMVRDDTIFNPRSYKWVNVIITCAVIFSALVLATICHLSTITGNGGPSVLFTLLGLMSSGLVFALLMATMGKLLKKATSDRRELEEVI